MNLKSHHFTDLEDYESCSDFDLTFTVFNAETNEILGSNLTKEYVLPKGAPNKLRVECFLDGKGNIPKILNVFYRDQWMQESFLRDKNLLSSFYTTVRKIFKLKKKLCRIKLR